MIAIILLYALESVILILRKSVLSCTQPIFFQGMRLTIAGFLLLSYLYMYDRKALRFKKTEIGLFFQASLFFAYLSYVLAVVTVDDLSSARYAFMFNLTPFVTAVIAFFYTHERLNRLQITSLVIGFVGFLPLILVEDRPDIASASFFSVPGLILFVSIIAYSYGWIVVSKLVNERNCSPFLVTGIAFMSAGITALLTSFVVENTLVVAPVSNMVFFCFGLLSIVFMSEVVFANGYTFLLKRYSATFLSFAGFLYPLFSAFLGWVFFKETITINFIVSAIIVCFALYLYYKSEPKKTEVEV